MQLGGFTNHRGTAASGRSKYIDCYLSAAISLNSHQFAPEAELMPVQMVSLFSALHYVRQRAKNNRITNGMCVNLLKRSDFFFSLQL